MPHNFSDDPNAFPGPPPSNNTKTVILVVATILGVVLLMCGGMITAGVFLARQATEEIEQVVQRMDAKMQADLQAEMQAEMQANPGPMAKYQRALANGNYKLALEAADEWLAIAPDQPAPHNNKAWLLATCPAAEFRDGELSVEHATKACELSDWKYAALIDTLAAAHAESGDFEAAAEWQQKAIDADTRGLSSGEFEQRLALYQSEQPYREGPEPAVSVDNQETLSPPDDAVESVVEDAIDSKTSQEQGSP